MNTILVTVDSLRYDHYQYMTHTQDFLGESHEHAYATATATLGTFPNVFTGTYTKSNEILTSFVKEIDDPTVGITTNRLVSERYGYDTGFDSFTSPTSSREEGLKQRVASFLPNGKVYALVASAYTWYQSLSPSDVQKSFRPADEVISEFERRTDGRGFAWLHFMEPHHPYDPNGGFLPRVESQRLSRLAIADGVTGETAESVRELYKREVIELDEQLKRLWNILPEDTRVIFTADHGEMLGEDGLWGHPGVLRDEILHVPFASSFDVKSDLVSSIDIPSYVLRREYGEGRFDRETAYASHSDESAAIQQDVIANEEGVFDSSGEPVDRPDLKRKQERFEPSGIVKEDAIREDLEDLGYI